MRNATAALVLVVSGLLGVGVGLAVERRAHLDDAAHALLHWTLEAGPEGGAVVRAEVLPGRDGRVALDARGGRGSEDILVPELQTERLVPAVVSAGAPVVLERRLRRVRVGEAEEMALRFSCRPPGPQGVFGVIEYNSTMQSEVPDGFGGLLRPLPLPGH